MNRATTRSILIVIILVIMSCYMCAIGVWLFSPESTAPQATSTSRPQSQVTNTPIDVFNGNATNTPIDVFNGNATNTPIGVFPAATSTLNIIPIISPTFAPTFTFFPTNTTFPTSTNTAIPTNTSIPTDIPIPTATEPIIAPPSDTPAP